MCPPSLLEKKSLRTDPPQPWGEHPDHPDHPDHSGPPGRVANRHPSRSTDRAQGDSNRHPGTQAADLGRRSPWRPVGLPSPGAGPTADRPRLTVREQPEPEPPLKPKRVAGERARQWAQMLEEGGYGSRAELARAEGVSRAAVSKALGRWECWAPIESRNTPSRPPGPLRKAGRQEEQQLASPAFLLSSAVNCSPEDRRMTGAEC